MDSRDVMRQNLLLLFEEYQEQVAPEVATWKGFAEYCEVNPDYMIQLKNATGGRNIGRAVGNRIAQAMGKPLGWISEPRHGLREEGARVGKRFQNLPSEQQDKFLSYLKFLEVEASEGKAEKASVSDLKPE